MGTTDVTPHYNVHRGRPRYDVAYALAHLLTRIPGSFRVTSPAGDLLVDDWGRPRRHPRPVDRPHDGHLWFLPRVTKGDQPFKDLGGTWSSYQAIS
ncbi:MULTISPECIES: hypothetical protein [unclassified Streptomyces]|uniref:hypothetical protein n=1 Tax=unclassified Streptomyces TaxID=2593676 RepID=UPI00324FC4C9